MIRTLDTYELLDELGHGGMATVYRARDTKLDRLVALKVMHPHLRGSAEARARFRREAQGVARLRHPCVLEIYDYSGPESDESYIATELLTGPTLRRFADDHPSMPAEIAACIAIEVCRALGAAHESGLVHRDVKPENILLHEGRALKLADFGIAAMLDANTMTATGQILGSPGHMAPEQIEGRPCDARSDLFALGTVLYQLACGRPAFSGRNPHQILKRITDGDVLDPVRVQPTVGPRLRAIILRALARDPDARPPSARALEDELRGFVARVGIDDPGLAFSAYVADPAGESAALRRRAIDAGLGEASAARARGDLAIALAELDRVLALDPDEPRAAALVERIGRGRRRRITTIAVGTAAALSVAGVGFLAFAPHGAPPRPPVPRPSTTSTPLHVSAPDPDAGPAAPSPPALATIDRGGVVSLPDASPGPRLDLAPPEPRSELSRLPAARRGPLRLEPVAATSAPRRVTFAFDPMNAAIGVDGAPPRPYGPSFSGVDVAPGAHRFVVESACCARLAFDVSIPPGDGPYTLSRRLESLPALLVVRTEGVAADVLVGERLRGRANEAIRVPIASLERREELDVTVSAPGRAPVVTRVRLDAGQPRAIHVALPTDEAHP